jgi:hypothetical protein
MFSISRIFFQIERGAMERSYWILRDVKACDIARLTH